MSLVPFVHMKLVTTGQSSLWIVGLEMNCLDSLDPKELIQTNFKTKVLYMQYMSRIFLRGLSNLEKFRTG